MRVADQPHHSLEAHAPGPFENRLAIGAVVVSVLTLAAVAPFARVPLGEIKPFISIYQSALFVIDLFTTVLLYGHFANSRSFNLLVLSCAYLFDSLMIIPHTMSFPDLFEHNGLIGNSQTTAWLYIIWHGGFAFVVLLYALLVRTAPDVRTRTTAWPLLASIGVCVAIVSGASLLATAGIDHLPVVMKGNDYRLVVAKGISPAVILLSVCAIGVLWPTRRKSVVNTWLIVVLCTWSCDVIMSAVIGSSRYDLGFYAGRAFGLLSSSFLVLILLLETNKIHIQLLMSREALARSQQLEAIGHLTGGVAHDFNNLLTIIVGALDIIRRSSDNPERVKTWATNAVSAAERGTTLVRQLLTFARKQPTQAEVIDINDVLLDLKPLLRQATGPQVELQFALAPRPQVARLDRSQFESAVLNLVVNARDAMPHGGAITIGTSPIAFTEDRAEAAQVSLGEFTEVYVQDTGVGMPESVAAKAVMPFFTTKGIGKGTGLGLSQAYGFAKASDGHLEIDSRPGAGTTVRLYFPLLQDAPPDARPAAKFMVRPASTGETMLVVEDDPLILGLGTDGLSDLGYAVIPARNADEALGILRADGRIDVLFSDIVMPGGMNGCQLAVEAKRIRPGIKVLLTTGYADEVLRLREIDPELHVIEKPYRREDIARKLALVA